MLNKNTKLHNASLKEIQNKHHLKKCGVCANTKWNWDDKRQNYYCENCLKNSEIILEIRDKVKGLTKVIDGVYANLKDWDNQIEEVLQVNSKDDEIKRKEYYWKELMRVRVKQIRLKIDEYFNVKDYYDDWYYDWNDNSWNKKQGNIYLTTLVNVANELFDIIDVFTGDGGDEKIDEVNNTIMQWILKEMPQLKNEMSDKYGEHYIEGLKQ